MPGVTEFYQATVLSVPQTDIGLVLTLVDNKFGLVYSLMLCRLGLTVAGTKSTPLCIVGR